MPKPCWKVKNDHPHHVCAGFRRMTIPRQAILDILNTREGHLSAEDIYLAVHQFYPQIGLATVYRTLELLTQEGLVARFELGDRKARYEILRSDASQHHHLICTKCGRVVEYSDFIDEELDLIKRIEAGLTKKYNFKIKTHLLQFYGLCEQCQIQ